MKRTLALLAFVAVGCASSTPDSHEDAAPNDAAAPTEGGSDMPRTCGAWVERAPCEPADGGGTSVLGLCRCGSDGGISYPIGLTVCCDGSGVVTFSTCSEWPIGCGYVWWDASAD